MVNGKHHDTGAEGTNSARGRRRVQFLPFTIRHSPFTPSSGFTLIELLVVLAIIAVLLSIAAPRYFGGIDRSKEAVLKEDLFLMREAIDQYRADKGRYPAALEDLVQARYLRKVPTDPITESDSSWLTQAADGDPVSGNVFDVRSGAQGNGRDGRPYAEW